MILKFDSSYYGTADMENLGYAGTPINERCYSKAELGNALHKVVAYAKCIDERGYEGKPFSHQGKHHTIPPECRIAAIHGGKSPWCRCPRLSLNEN